MQIKRGGGRGAGTILETAGLTREFRGFVAVKDVSLRVEEHTIHALIGPNGAGKTTCFNLLTKFLQPTRGTITLRGPRHHRPEAGLGGAARAGAQLPDLGGVPAPDRAGERPPGAAAAARRAASISGAARTLLHDYDDRARALLADVGLEGYENEQAGAAVLWPQAGAGDRHHAGARPDDDAARRADRRHDARGRGPRRGADPPHPRRPHHPDGRAQPVAWWRGCATRITVLARGQILAEGDYASVSKNPDVVTAYLGAPDA